MGDGYEHRKVWVEKRLELLANNYAVSVAGFAIMDNHLHVLVYSQGRSVGPVG
jgi:REP element-mobilizing transposase RayT